ncbi:MAG: antibiotic biosynthesis monooxygenase [Blastocatellia bacterium]|nr:antibiotic biosynthesis monooxygenase [Blastocatellia bacterium]
MASSEMEIYIFARFHARAGDEPAVEEAIRRVIVPTRQEEGCLSIHAFRSLKDARLFYIHSHWKSEEAFVIHAELPHTVEFINTVEPLLDHPLDVTRSELLKTTA